MAISISNDIPIYLCQNLICRLCGCTDNNNSFLQLDENHFLVKVIKKETKVQIKNDDLLPKTVCRICVDKVQMFQHFQAHCTKTQEVLNKMFHNQKEINTEFLNNEQNEMFEEWLDDEYDDFKKRKVDPNVETTTDKTYGVLYTDLNTFTNVRVSVNQNTVPENNKIVPNKILGRTKRERVKVVNKIETQKIPVSNNISVENWDRNQVIQPVFPDTMFLQINENKVMPRLYRIITNPNETITLDKNSEIIINGTLEESIVEVDKS